MKNKLKKILPQLILIFVMLALMIVVFYNTNDYYLSIINCTLIYFFCSVTVTLGMGLCGELSFATISFMGLGAFLSGVLARDYSVPPVLAIIAAVILTTLISVVFGLILLRLKGLFFVFGTIALVNIFSVIFQNYKPLTGGPDGLYNIPKLNLFGITFDSYSKWFWLLLILVILVGLFVNRIKNTSLGRAMMAVRDNEIAAQGMGINVYRTKLTAFVLSAMIAAFGGALLCFHNGVVSYSLFTFNVQMKFLSMAMLGGVNSILGTAFGTVLIVVLPEVLQVLQRYMNLIYGIGLILMMVFMPSGLAGVVKSISMKIKYRTKKEASDNGNA
jgi:branched-chain amino acid transport system permease protein